MSVIAVVTLLAALPPFGACIWPAPYAVRERYHLHFAAFDDDGADDLEMVLHDAACSLGDAGTELSMRELDAHAQLDAAPDDLDSEDAWYPTDYDEHEERNRKRGLDADSLRVGRLVVNGGTGAKARARVKAKKEAINEANPDDKAKEDAVAKDDDETKDDDEIKDDDEAKDDEEAKDDVEAKDDDETKDSNEAKEDVEAKVNNEAKEDIEAKVNNEAKEEPKAKDDVYDYASLRQDYDAETDALATPSVDAVTGDAESPPPAKGISSGQVHEESGRGGWAWPQMRVDIVFLVALGVYVVVAVPCYCEYGLCCCCFFWVPLCRPRDIVREAKRFAAQNPPGVMRIEAVVDVGKDVDADDGEDEAPGREADSNGADEGTAQATAGAAVLDGPVAARQARRRAVQAAAASEKRYRPSRGEIDAYNALMEALRGL